MSYEYDPPFRAQIRASGLGEVWTHTHDELKFTQFGWRCTNKENSYSNNTLVGNWNEQNFDIEKQKLAKRLPSQVSVFCCCCCFHNWDEYLQFKMRTLQLQMTAESIYRCSEVVT